MNEYIQAFNQGSNDLPVHCHLTGLYGRSTRGVTEKDFSRLTHDPLKRLSWVFGHQTLCSFLAMSHLDMLINCGHTLEWIRYQLENHRKFKLVIVSIPPDEVKLATWDNIFEFLSKVYPEIDPTIWYRYADQLKQMTLNEIDPEGIILKNYYLGYNSDGYMHLERFSSLKESPTLLQVRAFLHNHIGLNELFGGHGRTITHDGALRDEEYLTINRPLNEFTEYALLDLNPILL